MSFSWTAIKEFVSLPAAKQVVGGLLLVVGTLTAVIIYQDNRIRTDESGWKESEKVCGVEKLALQREYSDSVKAVIQRLTDQRQGIFQGQIAKLEEKEKTLDEALQEARKVIETQNRTSSHLHKITEKVSKIVK